MSISLLLVGCVGIPTESAIFEADPLEAPVQDSVVRVIARGPQPGMNQQEIVQGFLDASASNENDYAVARSFLAPIAASTWNPTQNIQIYDGLGTLTATQVDLVNFTATKEGSVNSTSRLILSPPNEIIRQTFQLVQLDGEWRIRNAPRGLLISKADLNRSYRIYPLWFPDLNGAVLVPDPVVVPQAVSGTATLLMQILLSGPSRDIASSVKTAFPQGVELALAAVTVENSIATVSLNSATLNSSIQQRSLMSAQITKTLTSIPGVNAVRINVGNQTLPIENKPIQQTASDWQELTADTNRDQSATVTFNGKLFQVQESSVSTPFAAFLAEGETAYRSGITDRTTTIYATLSEDGTRLYVGNLASSEPPQLVLTANSLRDPFIDRSGLVWITSPEGVQVVSGAEVSTVIVEEPLNGDEIVDVIPAPDGVRAAVILNTISGNQLRIATIERDATSIRLSKFRAVEKIWSNVSQVSWQTNNILLLLDNTTELAAIAAIDTLTGSSRIVDFIEGAVALSASPVYPTLVQTADGNLLESNETEWRNLGIFRNPRYPN